MENGPRVGTAGNVTLVAAILTVLTLACILFVSSIASPSNSEPSPFIIAPSAQTSASVSVANSAKLAPATSCVAPPVTLGDMRFIGNIPISIVGPTSACTVKSTASPGSASSANFTVVINATKPLTLTIGYSYYGNETGVLPPSLAGINFTAYDGIPNTAAAEPMAIRYGENNATLISIPSGETTFHFQAEVPNSVASGTYLFNFMITVSPADAGGLQGADVSFPVNLNA